MNEIKFGSAESNRSKRYWRQRRGFDSLYRLGAKALLGSSSVGRAFAC